MTAGTEVAWFQQPDPCKRRPKMLDCRIRAALKLVIERFIMIQEQADFRHEGRALGALFQRLLRHLPGSNVAGDGLDTDHCMILKTQLHALTKPDFPTVLRHGGKLQVRAGNALGYLSLVEALCSFTKILTNQFEVMFAQ